MRLRSTLLRFWPPPSLQSGDPMGEWTEPKKDPKKMRHGFTTGACAAAAAKGAVKLLVTKKQAIETKIWLPAGFFQRFELVESECTEDVARCATVKDAGDDPDATDKAKIVATAEWKEEPGVDLDGGPGVGRVTKPGLPVLVGEAAINPVPRRMIRNEVESVLKEYGISRGVRVVISVPDGEEIAKKTLNSRLGILGGISILGTRGTVVPFSTAAYKASIIQAIRVAKAAGNRHIVLTTGGTSEKAAMRLHPELNEEAFVQMGDFVGFALQHAKRLGVEKITLAGMIGKLSKVANGEMNVHSRTVAVDFGFLASVAAEAGASKEVQTAILEANTAMQAADLIANAEVPGFFDRISRYACLRSLQFMGGGVAVETLLLTMKGEFLGRAEIHG